MLWERDMPEAEKRPIGRPSKYDPTYCEVAIRMGERGKTWTAIAAELGVVRDTLYNWMDEHDEFFDAMKASRHAAQQWWEDTLQMQARGELESGASATAAIFAMKNQFPDDYRDRREHKVEANVVELDFLGYEDGDEG